MNVQYIRKEPYIKRIPTVVDRTYGVQNYDLDNLYPQRADEIRNESFTLKSAIDRITDFIKGQGFEDPLLANLVFNSEGHTGNELLDMIAQDKAPFVGIALHFKYNLNYRIAEITPLNWQFCRLGLPDDRGNVWDIKYNTNWERDPYKHLTNIIQVESYPIFNPDPNVVREEMEEHGWECYPGQILYWTPKPGVYPKARFDAVMDNAQTQAEIGVFQISALQNGFTASKIFKYPGTFENDKERQDIKDKLNPHKGSRGANSLIVVETPDGQEKQSLVEDIQLTNTDKMYEFTSKDARNAIRESMGMPAELLGQLPESGMFNQQQMQDSYTYANTMTQGDRDQLERIFKKIMLYWKDSVVFTSFKIKTLVYGATASQTAITGTPGQPGTALPGAAPAAMERAKDDKLSNLNAAESANMERIIRKVNKGKMSKQAGSALLKMSYGFSDDEVKAFLP